MKSIFIVFLFYIIGLVFLSLGVSLMILSNLGAGPWDAMYVGLSNNIGFTVGSWVFIVGSLLIIINGVLLRKIPDFLAVITIILIGSFIDFWLFVAFPNFFKDDLWVRIFMLTSGILVIAIGIPFYLQSNIARNPVDNFMMVIKERTGKSLAFTKTIIELAILVIAFLIGGPIGIGTIIVTIVIGPLIQLFYSPVTKFKKHLATSK
jgi:uncharacterized membrane protein YczE